MSRFVFDKYILYSGVSTLNDQENSSISMVGEQNSGVKDGELGLNGEKKRQNTVEITFSKKRHKGPKGI